MMTEDLGLSFYPQWEQAVESCRRALQKAERLQDEAARLLTVLETAPEEYSSWSISTGRCWNG